MMPEAPRNIDASVIAEPLDSVVGALGNKLEREWPVAFANVQGARELFLLTVRLADITSRSIRWLSADTPPDPGRRLEYCLSVPPLNRTILDSLFTIMFVLEDLPSRCAWYHKAAWREQCIELDRYRAEYGHLAEWRDWLGRLTALTDLGVSMLGLSPAEAAQPLSIPGWPNPGKMANYGISPTTPIPPVRAFMRYLNDWFYADLSQQAHLGGTGLMKRGSPLIMSRNDPQRSQALMKNKYSWIGQNFAVMLALISEIEAYFRFGLRERMNYLWGLLVPVIPVAKEIHAKRYRDLMK